MMEVPCGVVGIILNSEKAGHKIRVTNDAASTGGYFVYEWGSGSDGPNDAGAFDSWVEDKASLQRFVHEVGWKVQWLG